MGFRRILKIGRQLKRFPLHSFSQHFTAHKGTDGDDRLRSVAKAEIRKRSWRVQVLQRRVKAILALIDDRASRCGEDEQAGPGAFTGTLVKDYRGKDANQVVWKFDSAVEAPIRDALRHVAIEEGQRTEKRDTCGGASQLAELKARINRGSDRVAAAKRESLARGEKW